MWNSAIRDAQAGLSGHYQLQQAQVDREALNAMLLGRRKYRERFAGVTVRGQDVQVVFWGKTRIPAIKRGR